MNLPHATYRLQFRSGMDFERAASLAPYLAELGVSHLYASPLFQAMRGSPHGYDVTDHRRFDDSLGGLAGFKRLSAALRKHGLGLILDIVPNHMAASPDNPWWRDVLRHGQASAYAGHFDIDWSQPKLLIPVLGQPFGDALAAGEFALGQDDDGLTWRYFDHAFPLDPSTWSLVFENAKDSAPDPASFASWRAHPENAALMSALLEAISRDPERLNRIHEAQPWRLALWRAARDMLNYRRFFEIADLIGVRVELPRVFDDVHVFLFEMVEAGYIDGVRIDHVDGLAEPTGYLQRLRRRLPRAISIWVEKILARGESLAEVWPIDGTTGYEFATAVARVLTNPAALPELNRAYDAFTGEVHDYAAMLAAAKRQVLSRNLAAELEALVRLAAEALSGDLSGRDWGPDSLRRAIVALLCAMPVYRTYFRDLEPGDSDRAIWARVVEAARADPGLDDPSVVDLLGACLLGGIRTRFQQTSGALMAKAVEDTLFYRFHRLISANEVGSEPDQPACTPHEFHAAMVQRAATQPAGLSATATHDTKRGEDARMRIAAISESPEAWTAAVTTFDAFLQQDAAIPPIEAETRWLFYQALLGSWTEPVEEDLAERVSAFLNKAAREAQLRTSWVKPDPDYEAALAGFSQRALSSGPFLEAFADAASHLIRIGERKSLAQLALKLTLPGIPDIYQGTEFADLSFVDPDNRRPVDFDGRRRLIEADGANGAMGFNDLKMELMRFGLRLRRDYPDVFTVSYRPIQGGSGINQRVVAFVREGQSALLLVAVNLSGSLTAPDIGDLLASTAIPQGYRDTRSFPLEPASATTTDSGARTDMNVPAVIVRLFERP